jgi:hypothetical protein
MKVIPSAQVGAANLKVAAGQRRSAQLGMKLPLHVVYVMPYARVTTSQVKRHT